MESQTEGANPPAAFTGNPQSPSETKKTDNDKNNFLERYRASMILSAIGKNSTTMISQIKKNNYESWDLWCFIGDAMGYYNGGWEVRRWLIITHRFSLIFQVIGIEFVTKPQIGPDIHAHAEEFGGIPKLNIDTEHFRLSDDTVAYPWILWT